MTGFQDIACVRMTDDQKNFALDHIGKCNVILKKWFQYYPKRKFSSFLNYVMNGVVDKKCEFSIPENMLSEFNKDLSIIRAIRFEKVACLDDRSVELAILENYSDMAKSFASKAFRFQKNTGLNKDDFKQEAYIHLIKSIYLWLPHMADMSTYIYISLSREMLRVVNRGNYFHALSNRQLNLMIKYKEIQKKYNGDISFDEAVSIMELSAKDISRLNSAMISVRSSNEICSEDGESLDYTIFRKNLTNDQDLQDQKSFVQDVIRRSNLNPLELKLIEAAMNPWAGWQTDIAQNTICARTGKPFTRQRIGQVFEKAKKKVASSIKKMS
jgi:hypothetical protein